MAIEVFTAIRHDLMLSFVQLLRQPHDCSISPPRKPDICTMITERRKHCRAGMGEEDGEEGGRGASGGVEGSEKEKRNEDEVLM